MLKITRHIANPVIMLLLIAAFTYVYFFYLKDRRQDERKEVEAERESVRQNMQQADPGAVAVAATPMQEQDVWDRQNPLNMQEADRFFNQQNRQDPLIMREENPFNRQNMPAPQPAQVRYQRPHCLPQNSVAYRNSPYPNCPHKPITVRDKELQEGHWIGLEVVSLTPAIAKANNIPLELSGVLIDEVTLLSAEVGLLAGDVVTAINERPVKDLKSFREATRQVALSSKTAVSIYRKGTHKDIPVFSVEEFGVAQMESAPMILSTSRPPHGYYGPCDKCHAISMSSRNSDQLLKDQGDSLSKTAPYIKRGTTAPHENRGKCPICHVVL